MKSRSTVWSLTLAAVAGWLGAAAAARADLVPPEVQTPETMMENLTADLQGVVRMLGVDEGATLQFSTFTNPAAQVYNYSLNPGSTYLGRPIALHGSGRFDPVDHRWEGTTQVIATSSYGSQFTLTVSSADPYQSEVVWNTLTRGEKDFEVTEMLIPPSPLWKSVGTGHRTVDGVRSGPDVVVNDSIRYWPPGWDWEVSLAAPSGEGESGFGLDSHGSIDDFGVGIATVNIVPEPASLALLLLGSTSLLRRRRAPG
jgi:hypothetical protein